MARPRRSLKRFYLELMNLGKNQFLSSFQIQNEPVPMFLTLCNKRRYLLNLFVKQMSPHHAPGGEPPLFVTTRWSVVLAAQDKSSPASAQALETICHAYWYPIYALVRRQGHSPHDSQDLTQEFFARLLQKNYLKSVDRERGRLRMFLHVALKRFLANEWDRLRAQKRGGGVAPVSFDTEVAEQRYLLQGSEALSAERIYERQWAMTLLEQALGRLRAEYEASRRQAEFELLKNSLTAERGAIPYEALAAALKLSDGAARVAVHRLRKRFRALFRATIADTVSDPAEVDDEVRYVARMLGET
jgi:DNA-directed RNA polymerase specialized sigma24 family protein